MIKKFCLVMLVAGAAAAFFATNASSEAAAVSITATEGAKPLSITVTDGDTGDVLGQIVFPDLPADDALRAARLDALLNALARRPTESYLHNPNANPEPSPSSYPCGTKTFLGCWDGYCWYEYDCSKAGDACSCTDVIGRPGRRLR